MTIPLMMDQFVTIPLIMDQVMTTHFAVDQVMIILVKAHMTTMLLSIISVMKMMNTVNKDIQNPTMGTKNLSVATYTIKMEMLLSDSGRVILTTVS